MDQNRRTTDTWDQLAQAYQDKFMNLDLYDDTYDLFCQLLPQPGAKIFEIGCGPGNITKYLLTKRADFQVEAIDTSPNMIRLAAANNPTAGFRVMDCRDIAHIQGGFDGIMCGFCMPYLSKEACAKLIQDSANLLSSGGIFYFSTIEGEYQLSGPETSSNGEHTLFVYYHQEDYLLQFLSENSFELVTLSRKNYPKADGSLATHLIVIARKR
ncbi:class I SAM-dependent DNA methyltransferase [Sabulibacter ruber]|uniref:class I SAM-dependent DNA methyltransferase n=1 Tax=Sabulibacter ruber TaxID=2811901 RepID=UPI001A96E27E|nr:class I SAM-dependent methyltransferase [Sabulibacter ruber]